MKYSIIIPAYLCEATLENTVNSIQKCGLTDFEIILVEDGSPDGTPVLCDRIASEQSNVHCIHQSNSGVSSARNRGLSEAKGEYVWFFDSDDLVESESMVRAARIIDEYKPDMLLFGISFDFYRDGRRYSRWDRSFQKEGLFSAEELDQIFSKLYHCNYLSSSCNKLISRELLIKNDISFNSEMKIMEDLLVVVQALKCAQNIYVMPDVIYRYVHFAEQSGKNDNAVLRVSRIQNLETYMEPFEDALFDHKDVLLSLYYMLLEQRIRYETPKQLAVSAEHYRSGPFSKGEYLAACPEGSRKMADQLLKNDLVGLYLNHRLRTKTAKYVKKTALYKLWKKRSGSVRRQ